MGWGQIIPRIFFLVSAALGRRCSKPGQVFRAENSSPKCQLPFPSWPSSSHQTLLPPCTSSSLERKMAAIRMKAVYLFVRALQREISMSRKQGDIICGSTEVALRLPLSSLPLPLHVALVTNSALTSGDARLPTKHGTRRLAARNLFKMGEKGSMTREIRGRHPSLRLWWGPEEPLVGLSRGLSSILHRIFDSLAGWCSSFNNLCVGGGGRLVWCYF